MATFLRARNTGGPVILWTDASLDLKHGIGGIAVARSDGKVLARKWAPNCRSSSALEMEAAVLGLELAYELADEGRRVEIRCDSYSTVAKLRVRKRWHTRVVLVYASRRNNAAHRASRAAVSDGLLSVNPEAADLLDLRRMVRP